MAAAERQLRRRAGRWTLLARTIACFARADRRVILARPGTEGETLKRKLFAGGRDAAKGAPPGRCQLSVPLRHAACFESCSKPQHAPGGYGHSGPKRNHEYRHEERGRHSLTAHREAGGRHGQRRPTVRRWGALGDMSRCSTAGFSRMQWCGSPNGAQRLLLPSCLELLEWIEMLDHEWLEHVTRSVTVTEPVTSSER